MRAIMVVTLAAAAPAACQTFINPGFESGLEGWTVRNTPNGLGAPGTVTPTDIDGPGPLGASAAAGFSVGQVVHISGDEQGVEVVQTLGLSSGVMYQLDADWAAENTSSAGNSAAGLFAVILDGTVIAGQAAGPIAAHASIYGRLSARFGASGAGPHELGLRITRPWHTADATLTDFIDNITLTPAPPCYANCDGSAAQPILTVNDFACFINSYAAGDPIANCDLSTTPPVLNVADFACFLNAFAAGCS